MSGADDDAGSGDDGDADEHGPAQDVVAHLQTAALEVIAALRGLLDAAENVVRDPTAAVTLAASLAARARAGHGAGDGREGVQRIPVT